MGEKKAIRSVDRPGTRNSLAADFRRFGLYAGQTVLVHSSMSKLGWINGGAAAVIQALMDVLTSEGTLVMPTHTGDYSDPAEWLNPPVPKDWQEEIRDTMPLYDPLRTPSRGMGRIAELFRTWPDVLRSDHPQYSFAAWGREARYVTEGHELSYGLGETSPLARVYDLDGDVLLIGVGYDNNTSIHLAEYRAPNPPLMQSGVPWLDNGERVWVSFPDVEFRELYLGEAGKAFEEVNEVTIGQVAAATCRLMPQRTVVDFAVGWFDAFRKRTSGA